jgi:hypothetical protein
VSRNLISCREGPAYSPCLQSYVAIIRLFHHDLALQNAVDRVTPCPQGDVSSKKGEKGSPQPRQQLRIAPRRRRVHRRRLLRTKAIQVMRPTGFGPGA